jgi:signal transduction histidine kinase
MNSTARQFLAVALLLAAIVALFVAAESGHRQIEEASQRFEQAARRTGAIGAVLQVLSQAESAQRGYILLGKTDYLPPYTEAAHKVSPDLRELQAAFASSDASTRADIEEIVRLSEAKVTEMNESLDLYRNQGRGAATSMVRTDVGQRLMSDISERAGRIQVAETHEMLETSRSWNSNRWLYLAVTGGALAACVFLVLLLRGLVARHMHSKEREAEESSERQAELERLVKSRTEELSELSTQLQSATEKARSQLSRELHDELGGLLTAARMDASWLEDKTAAGNPSLKARFKRLQDALQAGVELKRRVVEDLRPTLLDNLGLVAALNWQVTDSCARAGITCSERYPSEELHLTPEASIAIFRIVQEALTNIFKHANAHNVEVCVAVAEEWLLVTVRDDGVGLPVDQRRAFRSHGMASMRHRAIALDGQLRISRRLQGGTEIEARLPLRRVVAAAAA